MSIRGIYIGIVILTLVSLPICILSLRSQEEKKVVQFASLDVKIRYTARDISEIVERYLWITTDEGATWRKAKNVEWKEEPKIGTYVIFHAPKEGAYGFKFQFVDELGHATEAPKPGESPKLVAIISLAPPSIQIKTDRQLSLAKREIKIVYRLEKDERYRAKPWISTDGGNTWTMIKQYDEAEDEKGDRFILYRPPADGTYGFILKVCPVARPPEGPKPGERPQILVLIDTTPPSLTLKTRGQQKQANPEVKIYYEVSDLSGLERLALWLSPDHGKSWKEIERFDTGKDERGEFVSYTVSEDGWYGFGLQGIDRLGNRGPKPTTPELTVLIDTTPPVIEVELHSNPEGKQIKTGRREIRIFYDVEDLSGIKEIRPWLSLDEGKTWKVVQRFGFGEDERGRRYITFRAPKDGKYSFVLQAIDALGNKTPEPKEGTSPHCLVLVDTTPPKLTLKTTGRIEQNREEIKIYYEVYDLSGLDRLVLWVTRDHGRSWAHVDTFEQGKDDQGNFVRYKTPEDGVYGLALQGIDEVGNETTRPRRPSLTVLVDTAPPVIQIKTPRLKLNKHEIRIDYDVEDFSGLKRLIPWVSVDGGKSWRIVGRFGQGVDEKGQRYITFMAPTDGEYAFVLQAVDKVGNKTPPPKENTSPQLVAYVDTAVPLEIHIAPPPVQWFNTRRIKIYYEVSEFSGIRQLIVWCTQDDGKTWSEIKVKTGRDKGGDFFIYEAPGDGTYGFAIQGVDELGNRTARPFPGQRPGTVVIVDTTAKGITQARRYFQKAALYRAQERWDEAAVALRKALGSWPQYPEALIDLGVVYYRKGDYRTALYYFLKAQKVSPADSLVFANAGMAYLRLGSIDESLSEFKVAIELGIPSRILAVEVCEELLYLGQIFIRRNRPDKAAEAGRAILKLGPVARDLRTKAQELIQQAERD
jgi:hypothetical protein